MSGKPLISDSVRFLVNAVLALVAFGLFLVLAFGVGWWMMSIWHNS